MTISNIIKTGFRAGTVALALAGTAVVAAPAQAAPPNVGFSLNFGNGYFGPGFGMGGPNGNVQLHFGDRNYFNYCMTNGQIVAQLQRNGYRDVRIAREANRMNVVGAVARKGNVYYQMRVNRCTGKVDQIKRVYRGSNNGFSLSFGF